MQEVLNGMTPNTAVEYMGLTLICNDIKCKRKYNT